MRNLKISIIGLGYVGLPLLLEMSKKFNTIGYDNNLKRISQLKNFVDINEQFTKNYIRKSKLILTNNIENIKLSNSFVD